MIKVSKGARAGLIREDRGREAERELALHQGGCGEKVEAAERLCSELGTCWSHGKDGRTKRWPLKLLLRNGTGHLHSRLLDQSELRQSQTLGGGVGPVGRASRYPDTPTIGRWHEAEHP